MLRKIRITRNSFLLLAAVVCPGCGDGKPGIVPVAGTVLYKGQPVEDASVTFLASGGRPATADTGEDGRFVLTTYGDEDGAVVGSHTVIITKWIQVEDDNLEGALSVRRVPHSVTGDVLTFANYLPERYASPTSSGLSVTVSNEENDFTFDLDDSNGKQ